LKSLDGGPPKGRTINDTRNKLGNDLGPSKTTPWGSKRNENPRKSGALEHMVLPSIQKPGRATMNEGEGGKNPSMPYCGERKR